MWDKWDAINKNMFKLIIYNEITTYINCIRKENHTTMLVKYKQVTTFLCIYCYRHTVRSN